MFRPGEGNPLCPRTRGLLSPGPHPSPSARYQKDGEGWGHRLPERPSPEKTPPARGRPNADLPRTDGNRRAFRPVTATAPCRGASDEPCLQERPGKGKGARKAAPPCLPDEAGTGRLAGRNTKAPCTQGARRSAMTAGKRRTPANRGGNDGQKGTTARDRQRRTARRMAARCSCAQARNAMTDGRSLPPFRSCRACLPELIFLIRRSSPPTRQRGASVRPSSGLQGGPPFRPGRQPHAAGIVLGHAHHLPQRQGQPVAKERAQDARVADQQQAFPGKA